MKRKNQELELAQLLRNDRVGEPDSVVEDRLMYAFLLKNSRTKVKMNSFSNFFGWLFSGQSLGLKTGLVSVVVFFLVMNNQISIESGTVTGNDSLFTKRVLVADSTNFIQAVDSIGKDSLN